MGKTQNRTSNWLALLVLAAVIGAVVWVNRETMVDGKRSRVVRTRTLVHAIDAGMQMFKADFGHLPHDAVEGGAETNDPRWIRRWLLGLNDDGAPDEAVRSNPKWVGPYVEFSTEQHLDADNGYVFVDAWGNALCFEVSEPIFNTGKWDVWSLGPDGKGTRVMSEVPGATPQERRRNCENREDGGARVNGDNVGNWE